MTMLEILQSLSADQLDKLEESIAAERLARFRAALNKAFNEYGFTPNSVITVLDPKGTEIALDPSRNRAS
jgi:hypothetical protein